MTQSYTPCKHCRLRRSSCPGSLCGPCYRDPGIRKLHPPRRVVNREPSAEAVERLIAENLATMPRDADG